MSVLFEQHRSDWEIRITKDEILRVGFGVGAMSRRSSDKAVVWVTKVSPTRRLWILRDNGTLVWFSADASPRDPGFALALPDHFIEEMMGITMHSDSVDLFCDETENVIVCRADGRYIAIDHPRDLEFSPFDVPYIGAPDGDHGHHAVATIAGADLVAFGRTCTNIPTRTEIDFYPFVKMDIGDGAIRWTMDWRRFGLWQLTRSFPASTVGRAAVTFYPWLAGHVMERQDPHADVQVFVNGPDGEYVYFAGEDWGVRIINDAEHLVRWDHHVRAALEAAGCTVDPAAGERIPAVIPFTTREGRAATASIHPCDEAPGESIRLMHVVSTNVEPTEAVMREINSLNDALLGARLVVRDGEVRITVDMAAQSLARFDSYLADFTRAIEACQGLEVFLPLFGS